MDNSEEHCTRRSNRVTDQKIDIVNTTSCPYCGMRFESSKEVLVHIFKFHSG